MQTTKPETAQQRPTGARMALLMLLYFIKIGAFTFGSGWSIIAQMEREFVDERGWMTKSDLLELIAVGKSLPGIMVANITLLFGYQMAGVLGGICAAIGLCISSFSQSLQQAIVGTFLLVVPTVMLSGFATPISSMPEIFQDLTLLNPMRYGLELIQRIFLEGAGFMDLWPLFGAITLVTIGTAAAAIFSFHRKIS